MSTLGSVSHVVSTLGSRSVVRVVRDEARTPVRNGQPLGAVCDPPLTSCDED